MPNTPKGLPYPAATDPVSAGAANIQALASAVDPWLLGPVSAAPPASPVDGQVWSMVADAAAGVVWVFRYRAASTSAYKWEFVGGGWLAAITAAASPLGTAGAWIAGTPTVTAPRAGLYLPVFSTTFAATAAPATLCIVSVAPSTETVGDPNFQAQTTLAANAGATVARPVPGVPVTLAAGQILSSWFWANVAQTQVSMRNIAIQPVCVS